MPSVSSALRSPYVLSVPSQWSLHSIKPLCVLEEAKQTSSLVTVKKGLMPQPATGHCPQPFLLPFHLQINLPGLHLNVTITAPYPKQASSMRLPSQEYVCIPYLHNQSTTPTLISLNTVN